MSTFINAAAIRAVRTAAQAALAVLGTGVISIVDVDFATVASISGGAALVSVLTSLVTGLPEADDDLDADGFPRPQD